MAMFQSTPPRGGRQALGRKPLIVGVGFNPRPHAGGDSHAGPINQTGDSFNPRPHAGGDPSYANTLRI